MKLYEFEGKTLLRQSGIPVPPGEVAETLAEAIAAADCIGYPVALKSQILAGGRGKAGGIQFADTETDLIEKAKKLFNSSIAGERVEKLLLEKKIAATGELYFGIAFDPLISLPALMISAHGGVDIETVAGAAPKLFFKTPLDPLKPIRPHHMIDMALKLELTGKVLIEAASILLKLVRCYFQQEALTAEINPLFITAGNTILAGDAKIEIDDSALFRHPQLKEFTRRQLSTDPLEAAARAAGIAYIRMATGNIGLISGGAGLGLATMDMIAQHGGVPANFLDLGGNASADKTAEALKIVLKTPGVAGVLLNVFGGINNCREMADGIARGVDELKPDQPIVVKMRGHSQEEGWALLEERNIPVVKFGTTEDAVALLLRAMKPKGTFS